MGKGSIQTFGVCQETVIFDDSELTHEFHVVSDEFPIEMDGIIGYDFLKKHKIIFDFANNCLTKIVSEDTSKNIKTEKEKNEKTTVSLEVNRKEYTEENKIKEFMTLKARTISYVNVEIENYEEQGIINKVNLGHGLEMSDSLVIGNNPIIAIMNISETDVKIKISPFRMEAFCKDIINNNNKEVKIYNVERNNEIKKKICLEHCNYEERASIESICEDFSDVFHVEGDTLDSKNNFKHEII